MRFNITLGLLVATASCSRGTDLLFAETRSGPVDGKKVFTAPVDVTYGASGKDLLHEETRSDPSQDKKAFSPPVDVVYDESPRFLQGLYDETSNAPADGEEK